MKTKYIEKNLLKGERIIHAAPVTPVNFKFLAPVIAISFVLGLISNSFLVLIPIPFAWWALQGFIEYKTWELAVTDKRVITKQGLLNHSIDSIKLDKVESVSVQQTFVGRFFNFGTVLFKGIGGELLHIGNVSNPTEFRKHAISLLG